MSDEFMKPSVGSPRRRFLAVSGAVGVAAGVSSGRYTQASDAANHQKMKYGMVSTPDGHLFYRRVGSGRSILFMQSIPFSSAMFEALMLSLADRFDCIGIDPMGYGRSDKRMRAWSVEEHVENIVGALETLGIKDPMIVFGGHFSGSIATEMAITKPSLVSHVILDGPYYDNNLRENSEGNEGQGTTARQDIIKSESVGQMYGYGLDLMKRLNPELTPEDLESPLIAQFAMTFASNAVFSGPPSRPYNMKENLGKIEQPTLIVGSPTDNNRVHHDKAFALVKNGKEFLFDKVNPLYQFNRPDRAPEYAAVIKNFAGA